MSRIQLLLILILVLGIVYGVFRHPQTQQYLPQQVKDVESKISFNQISWDKITDNQVGSWLQGKLPANTDSLPISEDTSQELQTLTDRAVEVGEQTQQVLGASIQPAEESDEPKPIYQSAVESGLYYYCKQVVTDYEKQHPEEDN